MERMYISHISQIGNSLGMIVPIRILRSFKMERGDTIVFGFMGTEQVFFRKMSDEEMRKIKGYEIS